MTSLTATGFTPAPADRFEMTAPLDAGDPPERPRAAHRSGDVIAGRYRIERLLERGGMADVYAATDRELQRPIALKVASGDSLQGDVASERLLREARIIARIQHPGVAAVHDHGRTAQGTAFLVLELVTGTTLRQFLAHAAELSWRTAATIATQLACALRAIHARDVVHGDLSPSNVLVARTDQGGLSCKLIDFGLACHEQEAPISPACGTRRYVAPEAIAGGSADVRADLYALGAILAEMLADATPSAPAALVSLTRSLQAQNPKARPPSAAAVLETLQQILAQGAATATDEVAGTVPGPSRLAWCVVAATVLLAVGALSAAVYRSTAKARPEIGRSRAPALRTPGPEMLRAELQPVPVRIEVATPDITMPVAEPAKARVPAPPRAVAVRSPSAPVRAPADVVPGRAELGAAVARELPDEVAAGSFAAAEVSLDPSERSARIVYRRLAANGDASREGRRDVVEYWAVREGRWQRLGD